MKGGNNAIGSASKHWRDDVVSRTSRDPHHKASLQKNGLSGRFGEGLRYPAAPETVTSRDRTRLHEFRKNAAGNTLPKGSRGNTLVGLRRRMIANENVEDGFPTSINISPKGEKLIADVLRLQPEGSERDGDDEDDNGNDRKNLTASRRKPCAADRPPLSISSFETIADQFRKSTLSLPGPSRRSMRRARFGETRLCRTVRSPWWQCRKRLPLPQGHDQCPFGQSCDSSRK